MGTPIGGWLLVIRVRGRKSGLGHDVPLSYLVKDGSAWVMAGFGPGTQWYKNLVADPHVELVLPGRLPMRAIAEEVRNREIRARILPHLVRATGMPGYMAGADPFRAPAERILEVTSWVPLIRLMPEGEPLLAGPDDPGGHGWIWRQAAVLTLTVWAIRRLVGLVRRIVGSRQRPGC
jgi:deazaflavin-dependent oxidoreductase (nitroreductase family)